ncbi:MAG: ATP-binding protein, partial [bacterium]
IPIVTGRLDSVEILILHSTAEKVSFDRWRRGDAFEKETIDKNFLSFTGMDVDGNGTLNLSINPVGNVNDKQGKSLALFILNSGKDAVKRGVMAVDMHSGAIVWEYLFGPQVRNIFIEDVDRDGHQEIVIGTYAPDNGAEWNGIGDDSSYVFLLKSDGTLRWKRPVGGRFTGGYIEAGDMTGDGRNEIVAYRYSITHPEDAQDEVMLLDVKQGAVLKRRKMGEWFTLHPGPNLRLVKDMNGDGQAELVVGSTDGLVWMLDADLKVTGVSSEFSSRVEVVAIADLDGDGINEILCITDDGFLHILNNQLQALLSQKLRQGGEVWIVQGNRKACLLIRADLPGSPTNSHAYALYDFRKTPFPTQVMRGERPYLPWLLLSVLVAALLFYSRGLLYGSYGRRMLLSFLESAGILNKILILRRDGSIERIGSLWQEQFGLKEPAPRGKKYSKVFDSMKHPALLAALEDILEHKKLAQSLELSNEEQHGDNTIKLASFHVPFLKYVFIQLTDLTEQEYIRRVKSWAPVAQRMAHGIKNPLTSVKLNAEELRDLIQSKYQLSNDEIDEYFDAIVSQVNKLTRVSDRFMRFVQMERPILKPVDINALTQELISQWLPENKGRIHVEFQLEKELPDALIDAEQFDFSLKTIFFNALESIEQKGRILITTSIVQLFQEEENHLGTKFIELQIRDTGNGIPIEILHKIGEPYVTNKAAGTGLGLSIVKKIIEEHEGTFEINSEEGVGTVVTLRFRIEQ